MFSCCLLCWDRLGKADKEGRRSERDRLRERERELEWDAADREAEERERRRLYVLEQERQRLAAVERPERSRKRSRSASRDREKDRERERNRDRDRERERDGRGYARSGDGSRRARLDDGGSSRGRSSRGDEYANGREEVVGGDKSKPEGGPTFDAELTADELRMMQAMGVPFAFDSTQGKHIEDESANAGAVKIKSKRSARQFMNRRGGFNRPLPAERTGEKIIRD